MKIAHYDERQVVARGKAHMYSNVAAIFYFILVHEAISEGVLPLSVKQAILVGIIVMIWVFAAVATWKDAYFKIGHESGTLSGMLLVSGIIILFYTWGKSAFGVFVALAEISLAGLALIRCLVRKREEQEEGEL